MFNDENNFDPDFIFSWLDDVPDCDDMEEDDHGENESTYSAEPIVYDENTISPKHISSIVMIRKMIQLEEKWRFSDKFRSPGVGWNALFYEQAKLMEDFTDNYSHTLLADSQMRGYMRLNSEQFRTYFTWRTNVRAGKIEASCNRYVEIYISELINQIGCQDVMDGYQKIKAFVIQYHEIDHASPIYYKLPSILKDYLIVYRLPISHQQYLAELPKDLYEKIAFHTDCANEIIKKNYQNILPYLNLLSHYKIFDSKFYTTPYGNLLDDLIPLVFHTLDCYFNRRKLDFVEAMFGEMMDTRIWCPFEWFSYFDNHKNVSFKLNFGPSESYQCEKGQWFYEIFLFRPDSSKLLDSILKAIEVRLREVTGYKRKLTVNFKGIYYPWYLGDPLLEIIESPELLETIYHVVDMKWQEVSKQEKQKELKKRQEEVKIDMEHFDAIRESSARIQEKLVTEEECEKIEVHTQVVEFSTTDEEGMPGLVHSLTEPEKEILSRILKGNGNNRELSNYLGSKNLLLEVIVEGINMKALEKVGDNIMEANGRSVVLYDEYETELKSLLGDETHEH